MKKRVLVANRGEIAIRIFRACRDLGWESVAIYADGDEAAPHLDFADAAWRIESTAPVPYLDVHALIAVARTAEAGFVHPGYGFLAENATFAAACAKAGLVFVGPPAAAIAAMGDKVEARAAAIRAGVPILPGTMEPIANADAALEWAEANGYPVALKAAAGGGGRGFRIARSKADLTAAFTSAESEAVRAFGDGRLYAERYVDRPRHVEVQVFADGHGTVVALGDRDCSIQRRHQKLVEECPAPGLTDSTREAMADAAVRLTRAVGYTSAGTLEFLVEANEAFWFLEMNTRIQVEHTVTEEVFGIDLVREQLLVAAGGRTSLDTAIPRGHSIQCRINAEDPGRDFAPSPGKIIRFVAPEGPGIRVDAASRSGAVISERYDSMIAKLVATGADREQAIARMERGLSELVVEGVPSTIPLHRAIMASEAFRSGDVSTAFLAEHPEVAPSPAAAAPAAATEAEPTWTEQILEVNGRRFRVRVPESNAVAGRNQPQPGKPRRSSDRARHGHSAFDGPTLISPLQGSVLRIAKTVGDPVVAGEPVMVIEAMKMENEIAAHRSGVLSSLAVSIGQPVRVGDQLLTIDVAEE